MRKNKKLIGITVLVMLIVTGCNSGRNNTTIPQQDTIAGLVGSGTSMHMLEVVLGRDTTNVFIGDSCDVSNANLIIGNLVNVIYQKDSSQNTALKITGNSTYVNALGNWTSPINGQDGVEGVCIEINGEASSINMHTLVYKQWELTDTDNMLVLVGESIGNGVTSQFRDTAIIEQMEQKWIMKIAGTNVNYTKE